jgi:hypothetical protein
MIFISHRGNLLGPDPSRENTPDYIAEAIDHGFHVEIDIWYNEGLLYLGHDKPQHTINKYYLQNKYLWCHAKNVEALYIMLEIGGIHCFSHDTDIATLTSDGYIWTYPGQALFNKSIAVLPEKTPDMSWVECAGICSDIVKTLQEQYYDLRP